MGNTDCKCRGNNPNCEKCFGRGYYDPIELQESRKFLFDKSEIKSPKKSTPKQDKQNTEDLSHEELKHFADKLVHKVDLYSKKQAKLLDTITFQGNYRHFFKWKFDEIILLEEQKNLLKRKIDIILVKASLSNITLNIEFKHPFSNIPINTNSSKELKSIRSKLHKK